MLPSSPELATSSPLVQATRQALAQSGPLANWPGFVEREAQLRLAEAIAQAMDDRATLIAEAGTGTGKTFAYLVPALLSGLRVIVSTGTRALQDQLFQRDLPRLRQALGARLRVALLKGRANYLCLYRLEQARLDRIAGSVYALDLAALAAHAQISPDGDISAITDMAEDAPVWPLVTSTVDNCLGSECPHYGDCFVVRARSDAQAADLVVVNHHLLFADVALKREGFGEILPGAHAFIIDEAHQWPELAVQFFSESLSSRQLLDLARDAQAEAQTASAALGSIQPAAQALERRVRELRLAWDPLPGRAPLSLALAHDPCVDSLDALDGALSELQRALEPQRERSPGLAACAERALVFEQRMQRLHSGNEAAAQVRWFELSPRGFSFQRTPLDVSAPLAEFRQRTGAAWVFTSATLAVDGRFEHFAKQLGADTPRTLLEQSPFDYDKQALAWLPSDLPDPAQRDYVPCLLQTVLPVLQASRGRAFLLFTSHRALREAADWLAVHADFPLFVQGSLPKNRLLEAFRQSGNGLLLGAASFWEGVDVAGTALSVVVIDKLPFAAPDDPVLEARLASIRAEGGNPFVDWQIPAAVIALKQGVGRLIRSETDRGLLVLCDPRLQRRSYGRRFLRSLPPFPLTRDRDVAARFVADC